MFLHTVLYEIRITLRNKDFFMWMMLFPVILGLFFKIAFTDLYEKHMLFNSVPVAVVQTVSDEVFNSVISEVSSGDKPLFEVTECDENTALSLLKEEKVDAVIYSDPLSLTVSGEGVNQTIAKSFLDQYRIQSNIIEDAAVNHPEKTNQIIEVLSKETECNVNIPLTENNMNPYTAYFYNLIAMVALLGSVLGLHISITNQANLSHIGARNNCSPVNKLISICATLCGSFIGQMICIVFCITFLALVLRVDFGNRLGFVYLSGILGGCTGVSMGFFIGSISKLSEGIKIGISMSISMTSCFLSGLMFGEIKGILAVNAPWLNKINPAAVIADSMQCLMIYDDYSLYIEKLLTMAIMAAVFTLGGFLLTRRRKYASL